MSLSSVAVVGILAVGVIASCAIFLESLSVSMNKVLSAINNLGDINEDVSESRIDIEEVYVSAGEGKIKVRVVNRGTQNLRDFYIFVDGKLVECSSDREICFPYEEVILSAPLESANLKRNSRIKVVCGSSSAYSVFE